MLRSMHRLIGFILAVLALSACAQKPTATPLPTRPRPTPLPTATPLPPLPTLPPVGSADNPVVFLFVNPDPDSVSAQADALAETISSELELVVQIFVTDNYGEARTAMCSGQASVISADAVTYLSALAQTCGEGLYIADVGGETGSQGEMLAGVGRSIFSIQGFAGYRFCRPDASSMNGWFVPTLALRANQVDPLGDLDLVVDSETDEGVIQDIATFKCDVGAARLGAREASPRGNNVIPVETLPLVPNDTVMLSSRLEGRARGQVGDNLRDHLDEIAALIGADGLVVADDKKFDELRQLFTNARIDVLSMGN